MDALKLSQRPIGDFSYEYTDGNLTKATKPDGTYREYRYEDPADTHNLTGIINENGVISASFVYDENDRAISSQKAGSLEKVEINYKAARLREIKNSKGDTSAYAIDSKYGIGRVKSASVSTCSSCPAGSGRQYEPNDRFQPETVTDALGNKTEYAYDSRGNVISITEASGGPDERATTFTWHSAYAFPETITRASASSGTVTDEYLYDNHGNLIRLTENKNHRLTAGNNFYVGFIRPHGQINKRPRHGMSHGHIQHILIIHGPKSPGVGLLLTAGLPNCVRALPIVDDGITHGFGKPGQR